MDKTILSLKNITKAYPGVLALNNVSIDFLEGEVHAILGENGAGKSTLIKIISGAIKPDGGKMVFTDGEYNYMTPSLSKEKGIEVIYQEFNLVEELSAAENIFLGEKMGIFCDKRKMEEEAEKIFKQFKLNLDPKALVRNLSPAKKQIVEIAKAISKNARILIMDEPSAPLSASEVEVMFDIINKIKKKNVLIIYISHRIDELFRISDRVTVMRDGQYITTLKTNETNRQELIGLMVGRKLKEDYPKRMKLAGEVALKVENLTGNGVRGISFEAKKGEILGVAGLVGSGRTEMAEVIFGAKKLEKGNIYINGERVEIKSPYDAIKHGIGLIPEDRKHLGCLQDADIEFNITLEILKNISRFLIINKEKSINITENFTKILNIKTPNIFQKVRNLSGGNQQKVVLAKTLAAESDIIIFDEPTRGIDVGSKQEIYKLMNQLADEGKAIIMITSDMEELLGMSDRIIVLSEGHFAGEVTKNKFDQKYIMELASGC